MADHNRNGNHNGDNHNDNDNGNGNGSVPLVTIEQTGDRFCIPENMDLQVAERRVRELREEQETIVAVSEVVDAFPLDGAVAFLKILKERYGWTTLKPTMGFWGPSPPSMLGVEVRPGETIQVPWGSMTVPKIDGTLSTGVAKDESGLPRFRIGGEIRRKHESHIKDIAAAVRKEVLKSSIYRGKALRINFRDSDGDRRTDFGAGFCPKFIDLGECLKPVIYSEHTRRLVQTTLWNPIQFTERCRKVNAPLKRGILLAGSYGTGKTLTAYQTAHLCVQNGWTFVYLQDVRDLDLALSFARHFEPCLLFAEDCDRAMAGPRSPEMDQLLNTIDGIESKNREVMVVFTSNHKKFINPAFIRPGRIDSVIEITAPDEAAAVQLIRNYGETVAGEVTLSMTDKEVWNALTPIHGANAAFVQEAVERAKLAAIGNFDSEEDKVVITKEDLNAAAATMVEHVKALQPELEMQEMQAVDPMKLAMDIFMDQAAGAFFDKLINPKTIHKVFIKGMKPKGGPGLGPSLN